MKNSWLSFFLFFNLCVCLFSQENSTLDSLLNVYASQAEDSLKVNTIGNLYNAYLYNNQEKAKQYAFEGLKLSRKINFGNGVAKSLYHIGVYYNNIDNIDSAMVYYTKSLDQYKKLNNFNGQTKVNHGIAILHYSASKYQEALNLIDSNIALYHTRVKDSSGLGISLDLKGSIHSFLGNHQIALRETLKALRILQKTNDPIRVADVLSHLGNIEFFLDNFEKAKEYYSEAIPVYRKYNDKYYESQVLNDLGNCLYYLDDYKKAIHFLEQSIDLSKEIGSKDIEATALNNLGKAYSKLGNYSKALEFSRKSLAIVEGINSRVKVAEALGEIGRIYHATNKPEVALDYFNRQLAISNSTGVKQNQRIGYHDRSGTYESLKDYKSALEDYKLFKSISDSIFNTKKSQQIEELRTIYDTEKKEQQIALQEKEITVLEQKEEISTLQKIVLGSLLVISLFGFYGIRQKLKRNKLEKERMDTELAFKKKELTTHALHLAKKNEVLEGLKQKAKELKANEASNKGYQQLIRTIDFDLQDDNNWENFSHYFEQVHKDFNSSVKRKYPEVTSNELRLMALLKMNLSSKEIANILNISQEGIKKARYRLRKKLGITTEDSLQDLVLSL